VERSPIFGRNLGFDGEGSGKKSGLMPDTM